MAAAAHDPDFAKRVGIPQGVAQEFNQSDAGTGILNRNYNGPGRAGHSSKQRTGKLRSYTGK